MEKQRRAMFPQVNFLVTKIYAHKNYHKQIHAKLLVWLVTFDFKELLNERKECYQQMFSNERIFKQKKPHFLPMNQQVSTVWGPDRLQIHGAAERMNQ